MMGSRGPVGKSEKALRESGRYRPGEHSSRAKRPKVAGAASPPKGLCEPGKTLWFQIIDFLQQNGLSGEVDSAAIEQCCWLYNKLVAAQKHADAMPIEDKNARTAVTGYYTAWQNSASKLGITPADRARLERSNEADDTSEDKDLLD